MVCPLPSIPNTSRQDVLRRLRMAIQEHHIDAIVVGLPLNMDGSCGEAVRRIHHFMGQLRRELRLPVWEVDERLSTVEAMEMWRSMNARQQRRYRTVDSLAAAFILERFLKES